MKVEFPDFNFLTINTNLLSLKFFFIEINKKNNILELNSENNNKCMI